MTFQKISVLKSSSYINLIAPISFKEKIKAVIANNINDISDIIKFTSSLNKEDSIIVSTDYSMLETYYWLYFTAELYSQLLTTNKSIPKFTLKIISFKNNFYKEDKLVRDYLLNMVNLLSEEEITMLNNRIIKMYNTEDDLSNKIDINKFFDTSSIPESISLYDNILKQILKNKNYSPYISILYEKAFFALYHANGDIDNIYNQICKSIMYLSEILKIIEEDKNEKK